MTGTVLEFISSTIDTLKGAQHYYDSVKDDKDLKEAFHAAGNRLTLIMEALQLAHKHHKNESDKDLDTFKSCSTTAELAASIFRDVAGAPVTSRFESYKSAVTDKSNGRTVEVLVKTMMSAVCNWADRDPMLQVFGDYVKRLREAIEELSKMESSIPTDGMGHTFNHYGSGDQNNAPGGTVNKSSGNGNHFPGASFYAPLSFSSSPAKKVD